LQDDFNLTGLNVLVPYYDYALDMVLDVEMPMEDSLTEEQQEIVESAAVCDKLAVHHFLDCDKMPKKYLIHISGSSLGL
jgi:hypothetical protein